MVENNEKIEATIIDTTPNSYGNSSISTLEGADQVRKKPAVIFGTEDVNGCAHSVFEIISNSIDEAREGYGNRIEVTVNEDYSIKVRDYGRGVPMDFNPAQGKFNWELVYCTLYASGKYDADNYKTSLGLNGLGCTATQYASEYMVVTSIRDGFKYIKHFEKGVPVGDLEKIPCTNEKTGTTVEFKPDAEVFSGIDVPMEFFTMNLRRQAMLHGGIKFVLNYMGEEIEYLYKSGAVAYLKEMLHKAINKDPIRFYGQTECKSAKGDYNLDMEIAIHFSREENSIAEVYHNGGYLVDGGATQEAFETAMCQVISEYGKLKGKVSKGEKIVPKYLDGVVNYIGATGCPGSMTEFKNQTKTAITNKEIKKNYQSFIYTNVYEWFTLHEEEADRIVDEILINKKAFDSADAIKKQVLRKLTQNIDNPRTQPEKFVDCQYHGKGMEELWIVEGDSALGSCVQARDSQFQAIIPVRGKIINCLKNHLADVLGSEIIVDLIRVLGCGIEAKSKQVKDLPPFNLEKLRWDKVVICTDADIDGMQIRCLIIAMFYKLAPTLLKEGRVYIAETPLFEITAGKETLFAYSDAERDKFIRELETAGKKYKIQRSKGLGENEPDMMWQSTMCPDSRRLVRVEMDENDTQLGTLFTSLLGDDLQGRKELVRYYFDRVEETD